VFNSYYLTETFVREERCFLHSKIATKNKVENKMKLLRQTQLTFKSLEIIYMYTFRLTINPSSGCV